MLIWIKKANYYTFLLYIKMSVTAYYQRKREKILNREKKYYQNKKKVLKNQKNKHRELLDEKKIWKEDKEEVDTIICQK